MKTIVVRASLALEKGLVPGSLTMEDGRIREIRPGEDVRPEGGREVFDAEGGVLAPGFIDLHCHGGAGADVNDADDEALETLRAYHRSRGVTSFLPSLSVDPLSTIERAFGAIRRAMAADAPGKTEILGAHFESPYINPRYKGCQASERLLPFDADALAFIMDHSDVIARVTLAPELPGVLEALPLLREKGLTISVGHSEADVAVFRAAVDRGATLVTHLYNAMSSVRKEGPFRIPGVLEAALTDDRVFTELICDGKHVPAQLIEIARRCKGPDRFLVCSDANRGAGLADASVLRVCGREAIVEDGVAMLADRSSLASSVSALDRMVRVLVKEVGVPLSAALRAASAVPAAAIGVDDRKGKLEVGYDADLVLLDGNLEVKKVWCRGE